jgi:hypothetical protein
MFLPSTSLDYSTAQRVRMDWYGLDLTSERESQDGVVWTGVIWLRIGTGNEPSTFIECWEVLWVAAQQEDSEEGFSSIKLVRSSSHVFQYRD